MSIKKVLDMLKQYGINPSDIKIYFFVNKKGQCTTREIYKELHLKKQQVYPCLENLQNKGLIYAITQRPMTFCAFPLEETLDNLIRLRVHEAENAQKNKAELVKHWRDLIDNFSNEL